MRKLKIIVALLMVMSLLNFSSCAVNDVEYSYSIKDALKISTWILDESLDVNGYWLADEKFKNHGWWVGSDGKMIDNHEDDVFAFEQLKLNEVKTMAPGGYMDTTNFSIFVEFDGIVEVEIDSVSDEYIRLGYSAKDPSQPWSLNQGAGMIYENIKLPYAVYVDVCPYRDYASQLSVIQSGLPKPGNEYYLNVNAYNFGNEESPVIRARLKLTALEDKGLLEDQRYSSSYVDKEGTRLLSVEVVSYEYSERYMFIDELFEEDTEDDE